jgi:hypothetical protein
MATYPEESMIDDVRNFGTECAENTELSLVERVCAFLDRYAIAHASEAGSAWAPEIAGISSSPQCEIW